MLSLFYLLLAIIPVLFYVLIIWSTTPWKSIDLKTAFQYSITGVLSIALLITFFYIFPNWQKPIDPTDLSFSLVIMAFVQVAMVEEISKLAAFKINESIRGDSITNDSPIGTMFYSGISALGFAFMENVKYALMFGGNVLIFRSFITIMVHFLCGLVMGYWISVSRLPSKLKNRSLMEVSFIRYPNLKKVLYHIIGILFAVLLHGLYDYNIFSYGEKITNYLIIIGGIVVSYLMFKDLNEKFRKTKKRIQ